ncbi:integrator complex subunit 10 [Daktulosphaira vitifoliae]|uniref:integrator complex subunit 10 n=1 Tax=Daktulosphaira vitifoliae TaxID=58002 RepID=UPI0021A9893A|nr:integrator complex subunit 10 [Daktulosphaira vitifoliae]
MEAMDVSMCDEDFMMTKAKSFLETDSYRCRSWLLTAKSMFPTNFSIHYECYVIEKNLHCVQRAARCFSSLLEDFPNEHLLWKEIENFTPVLCMDTACLSEEQTFFREMFSALPLSIQQKLLSVCAERSEDTMEHCRLVLLLLNRFPQSSTELALQLMDTMITAEKHNQCPSVINCYRKILVCDLGPLLVSTNALNQKNLYKILTKTTEFYITYAMGGHTLIPNLPDTENCIKTPWEDLFTACERIGKKLSWELRSVLSQSDRRKAWKKVSSFAKKFVIASNNSELSKQLVFCGMILFVKHVFDYNRSLKSENEIEYLLVKAVKDPKGHIIKPPLKQTVLSVATKLNESLIGITSESSEVLDNFKMAFNYWELLTNKEPMCTDYWKLSAQIKVDTYIGQFLSDIEFYQGKYKNLLKSLPAEKSIRKSLSLVSLYYCVQEFKKCTENIFEVVEELEELNLHGIVSSEVTNPPPEREMYYIQIAKLPILQYCTKILIQILFHHLINLPTACDLIGHLLVLCQMVWPAGEEIAIEMYRHISELTVFTYPQFSIYITNIDIIEQFMAMFIENDKCVLNIFPCVASSLSPRISTRGSGKGVKEEFRLAIKKQVLKCSEPIEETIMLFLKMEKESLMKTASLIERSLVY